MKKYMLFISILVLICFVSTSGLSADIFDSVFFDMSDFPQWARDLRRGNIISFGIFPFAYLIATFGFDTYRYATNNWDRRYAPWPFNSAGSISMSQNEMYTVLGAATGTAILFALVDHGIVRIRRNRLEREIRRIPEGTPVIIRHPLHEEEDDIPDMDVPENNNP